MAGRQAEADFFYGFVYFRQIRDKSAKRGYFQKSLVLMTRLPFVTLFKTVVAILANELFESGEEALARAARDIDRWPSLRSGASERLPLLGSVLQVRIPHKSESLVGPATTSPTSEQAANSLFLMLDTGAGAGSGSLIRNGSFGSLRSPSKSPSFASAFSAASCPTILVPSLSELNLFKCFFPILTHVQTLWVCCSPSTLLTLTCLSACLASCSSDRSSC